MRGKLLRYITNLSATFLSQAASALIIVLLTPVLVKQLGTSDFGVYGLLLSVIAVASVFDFGLNIGLLRRLIHEKNQINALVSSIFFFYLLLFAISVPVFFALYATGIVKTGDHTFYKAFFTAVLVIQTILSSLFDVIIQTANKIFVGKIVRICKLVVEFVALYLLSAKGSVTLLLLVSSLVNLLYIIALFYFSRREVAYHISYSFSSRKLLFQHIRDSVWYFLTSVSTVLAFSAQTIMISSLMEGKDSIMVARYVLVTRFFDVIRIGLTNFTIVLFPTLVTIQSQGNWLLLKRMYFTILRGVGILVIIFLAALMIYGPQLFTYWSKEGSADTILLFRFFAVFIMMIVFDNVSAVFLNALGFNKLQTIVGIAQGVMGLLLGFFLFKGFGLAGIAMGSVIALLCTNFIFNPVYLIKQIRRQAAAQAA
jgi:O-antigen/teichoic acid export membrane protein